MVDASLVCPDGRTVPLRNGFLIGRVAGSDLIVDDSKCSRRHARIVVEGGVAEVEDLESSNGTLLNGKPVQRRVLRDGDQIQIGKTVLVYREGLGAGSGAAAAAADDDLFADAPAATAAPGSASPPRPVPAPKPAPAVAPPPSPPPAAPRTPAVVEFADEVVQVRPAAQPKPAAAAPTAAAEPQVQTRQRVLQFQQQSGGRGPLADDLAQLPTGVRLMIYAGVLAAAAGLAWLVMWLVRGS